MSKASPASGGKKKSRSTVVKQPISIPKKLFAFAVKESRRIGKDTGARPNLSQYIASLIFAAKFRREQSKPGDPPPLSELSQKHATTEKA